MLRLLPGILPNFCLSVSFNLFFYNPLPKYNHLHLHLPLNHEGPCGITGDFTTNFLHFFLFSTALLDFAYSRPVHSLMLSPHGWEWLCHMNSKTHFLLVMNHTSPSNDLCRWLGITYQESMNSQQTNSLFMDCLWKLHLFCPFHQISFLAC